MKLSVCHLLLPPLILLFCCHCLAAKHGKVYADNQHSIYNTNPLFEAMGSDLNVNEESSMEHFLATNSDRVDFPCPESAAIAPCTCRVDVNDRVHLDCTYVTSLDQLVEVFQQEFPIKELYQFSMANNSAINGFPSFMNGVTFEIVNLDPGRFTLAGISEHFLFDLKDTLKEFTLYYSQVTTDFFPFFMLPSMNQLESLDIYHTDINRIPKIRAPKLTYFSLTTSSLKLLENGTFPIGTGPMLIGLYYNQIHTIEAGSFFFTDQNSANSHEHIYIYVFNNQLQSLKAGTFPLRNGQMIIHIQYNQISSIEPGTFVLPASRGLLTIDLSLRVNNLTTFDEAVFASLMPYVTFLDLSYNPLTCGCDIAWLILNEGFMASVDGGTCADGTDLHDLDRLQYIDFCYPTVKDFT